MKEKSDVRFTSTLLLFIRTHPEYTVSLKRDTNPNAIGIYIVSGSPNKEARRHFLSTIDITASDVTGMLEMVLYEAEKTLEFKEKPQSNSQNKSIAR